MSEFDKKHLRIKSSVFIYSRIVIMLRFLRPRLFARSASLLASAMNIPEGFSFIEDKAVDKDINAGFEHLETLRLTLTRQDEFLLKARPVRCVTVRSTHGEHGIFPSHAYEILKLVPAPVVVELADGTIEKFFTSGGFAHVNSEGSCDINCAECIPLEDLDLESAEKALAEQNSMLSACKDDVARAVIEIRIGVLEAVVQTLKQTH